MTAGTLGQKIVDRVGRRLTPTLRFTDPGALTVPVPQAGPEPAPGPAAADLRHGPHADDCTFAPTGCCRAADFDVLLAARRAEAGLPVGGLPGETVETDGGWVTR